MEEVLDFDSIPEGYEVAFPRKETPSQRRVRLVEMYAGAIAAGTLASRMVYRNTEVVKDAITLAEEVISATTEDK